MSENVNYSREKCLPLLMELRGLKLFGDSELNEITRRLTAGYYSVVKRQKCMDDYHSIVEYYKKLLKLSLIKLKKRGKCVDDEKRLKALFFDHISKFYKQALKYDKHKNSELWQDFADFLISEKKYKYAAKLYEVRLNVRKDTKGYLECCRIYSRRLRDYENAKSVLFAGIRAFGCLPDFLSELLELELKCGKNELKEMVKTDGEVSADSSSHAIRAKEIFTAGLQEFRNEPRLVFQLLSKFSRFKFMRPFQRKAYRMMKKELREDDRFWDCAAKFQLDGVNLETDLPPGNNICDGFTKKLWNAYHVYRLGIEKTNHPGVWGKALEEMSDRFEQCKSDCKSFAYKLLDDLLKECPKENANHFHYHLRRIISCVSSNFHPENLKELINSLIRQYPEEFAPKLWKLTYLAQTGGKKRFIRTFCEFLAAEEDDSKNAEALIKYLFENELNGLSDKERVIQYIYRNVLSKKEEMLLSPGLRTTFATWLYSLEANPDSVDYVGNILKRVTQNSTEWKTYKLAIDYEMKTGGNSDKIREYYEAADYYLGNVEKELWSSYYEFEREFGSISKAANVYRRAVKKLPPALSDEFASQISRQEFQMST